MNVTFSCKVLSRWAQLVSVFSRMFKFSRIVIYRAKSRRSGLEWGDLPILFNRNNCSLSVGVFSFSLIWESIAAQFLTFVPHGEQTLVEKDSPSSMKTKSSFFSRSANFGNVSPFRVGATNTFFEPIHLLIKLPNCVLKFYNFSEALGSFGLLPLLGAGTGFVGVLPLPLIFDPPHSPSINHWVYQIHKELWPDFWQLDDIFEPPGRNEFIVWKTDSRFFFSRLTRPKGVLGSRTSRA